MKLEIIGLVGHIPFHQAQYLAKDLFEKFPKKFDEPTVVKMLEFEWSKYIEDKIKEVKGEMWAFKEQVIVFLDGLILGSINEFSRWAVTDFEHRDFRPIPLYTTLAEDAYKEELESRKHIYIHMEIEIDEEPAGSFLIELYNDIVPKTCENFRALCTGEKGESEHNEVETFKLHYQHSIFFRLVPNGWIQGGDIWYGRGSGGESIYGPTFEDESFAIKHDRRGILSMANRGRHTNQSQFFITLTPGTWMDTRYVAFGAIIEGSETLKKMEAVPTMNERPVKNIKIKDAKVVEPKLAETSYA